MDMTIGGPGQTRPHRRESGPPQTARATPPPVAGDHTVQFYLDDASLTESVSRHLGAALSAGNAALVAATPDHTETIERNLATALDLGRARSEGRFVCLDAAATLAACQRDGNPDPASFREVVGGAVERAMTATARPAPRVAVFGELVALLTAEGKHDQAITLEHLWNELVASHPVSLVCGYPLRDFSRLEDEDAVRRICDAHSAVIPAESYPVAASEDERRRSAALLQQRAQVVEAEARALGRAQATLRRRETELSSARTSRDEFLVAAAHELKTPITSLRVYAQLLQRDVEKHQPIDPRRLARALQAIERQTGQLNLLISRLVDLAHLETTSLDLEPVAGDVAAVVRDAVAALERSGSHRVALECPASVPAVLDPARFTEVVSILLANAVKFSPGGSRISVSLVRDPGGAVRLTVEDEGVGIAPNQRERIFERFHKAHSQAHLNGFGLGLYLARQIVTLHGGTIRVEQPAHPGARFVIELPAGS